MVQATGQTFSEEIFNWVSQLLALNLSPNYDQNKSLRNRNVTYKNSYNNIRKDVLLWGLYYLNFLQP